MGVTQNVTGPKQESVQVYLLKRTISKHKPEEEERKKVIKRKKEKSKQCH